MKLLAKKFNLILNMIVLQTHNSHYWNIEILKNRIKIKIIILMIAFKIVKTMNLIKPKMSKIMKIILG